MAEAAVEDADDAVGEGALAFGGYKQSGNGRELGRAGIEDFTELKAIHRSG